MKPNITGFFDKNQKASFKEILETAKKHQIEYISLRSYNERPLIELTDKEIKEMMLELKLAKIKISIIDSAIKPYDIYNEKKHQEALDQFRYMTKFADKFKTTYLYLALPIFNDVIEEFDHIKKIVTQYIEIAVKASKKIILVPRPNDKANIYAYLFKKIKSKEISYAFDPVFLLLTHESTTTAYRLLKNKIGIIHAIDSDILGVPTLLGYGKTNVIQIFKKLLRDRYDGFISADNHFYSNVFDEKPVKTNFIKKLFSKEKKKKENQLTELSRKIFPNEQTKNVTYDDILENQLKVIHVIFK